MIFSLKYSYSNGGRSTGTGKLTQEIEATGEDVTALNEELLDSLRLLNYEKDYVQK